MLNEAIRYIAGASAIDLADIYFLPPTRQLNELLKREAHKSQVGEVLRWWKKVYNAWHLVDLPPHLTDADVSGHGRCSLDLVQILSGAARDQSSPLPSLCRHGHLWIKMLMLETNCPGLD